MPRLLVYAVYAFTLLAFAMVTWSWLRWARSTPHARPALFRRLSTASSLTLLSVSVLVLMTILVAPGPFSGLHGNEPMFRVFMLGVFAAVVGSVVGSWAVEAVRDLVTPTAWVLVALYVVVMSDLEPGSW